MHLHTILVEEHVHIMKVIKAIEREIETIKETKKVDTDFIDTIVDFIRTYADKTHHGKEEDILFRNLAGKNMSEKDKTIMQGLLDDHVLARKTIGELVEAKDQADVVIEKLKVIIELYPTHICSEDKIFFPAADNYFNEEEQISMLEEGKAFDAKMEIDKYVQISEDLQKR